MIAEENMEIELRDRCLLFKSLSLPSYVLGNELESVLCPTPFVGVMAQKNQNASYGAGLTEIWLPIQP